MQGIINWIGQNLLWEALLAILGTAMSWTYKRWISGTIFDRQKTTIFWTAGIAGGTIILMIFNLAFIEPLKQEKSKPNFKCERPSIIIGATDDDKTTVTYILKVVNSGVASIAWKWHLKVTLVLSGQTFETDADENPQSLVNKSSKNTETTLESKDYLPNALLESSLGTGSGKRGWVIFRFDGISMQDMNRIGNKFTLTFQDSTGNIITDEHLMLESRRL